MGRVNKYYLRNKQSPLIAVSKIFQWGAKIVTKNKVFFIPYLVTAKQVLNNKRLYTNIHK